MSALLKNTEIFYVSTPTVSCDGDKESPHPRVFLAIGPEGSVECPYCSRHYQLKEGAVSAQAH